MKVTLLIGSSRRDEAIRSALVSGFKACGEKVEDIRTDKLDDVTLPDTDLAVFFGLRCMRLFWECERRGIPTLLIDKGYFNRGLYYRVSLGGYQPPYFHELDCDDSRLRYIGVRLKPRNLGGNLVIYAGSSEQYARFHDIKDVHAYAEQVCDKLVTQLRGRKRVVYRPKPSWWKGREEKDKETPVPDSAAFMDISLKLSNYLKSTYCLVTHGSNAAVEALINGVPVIMLSEPGVNPVLPLCETKLEMVSAPYWPEDTERMKLLSNLAWCQFTTKEIEKGFMWNTIRQWYGYKPKGVEDASVSGDQF